VFVEYRDDLSNSEGSGSEVDMTKMSCLQDLPQFLLGEVFACASVIELFLLPPAARSEGRFAGTPRLSWSRHSEVQQPDRARGSILLILQLDSSLPCRDERLVQPPSGFLHQVRAQK